MTTRKKLLVTTALDYANGPLHLGHMVEKVQADIWVRFQRLRGYECVFICGDDAHGTPIMLSAEKQGITPEAMISQIGTMHKTDLSDFHIGFDNFDNTHSTENKELVSLIYKRLRQRGDIVTRIIEQLYDPEKNMFLPDRFVKGECPNCGAADQYGDNCEVCGATYTPTELKNPSSAISGAKPILKTSEHYFFCLDHHAGMLRHWIQDGHVQAEVVNKLLEWFKHGLQQWDISRDAPYFGFEIPDVPGKYFYVWLDAPVGYISIFKNLCAQKSELNFAEYWESEDATELYHFIGKDIVYFHALFWPAMLEAAKFRKPTQIFTHGFLTINGQKMSKSRGTFITARKYLENFDAEYLRYYFAAKLGSGVEDIDLNMADFVQRVNSDLVGKVVNIASRCASFINKLFAGQLAAELHAPQLWQSFIQAGDKIAEHYHQREFNQAVRSIMALADQANQYIDEYKPWMLAKQAGKEQEVQAVCTMGINLFYILIIYLAPILPVTAKKAEAFLNTSAFSWYGEQQPLLQHTISAFTPLLHRIDADKINLLSN